MGKTVDYFFSPSSPWTYLGHTRFAAIARAAGAQVNLRPVDYGKVFPVSGGLPLKARPLQRQAYRVMELKRWRAHLGMRLNLDPAFFPVPSNDGCKIIIAAETHGSEATMTLAGAIMRACWAEEENIADAGVLAACADSAGLPGTNLMARVSEAAVTARFDAYTEEAITRQVFGAPTFIVEGELFWGQDRLDFLERALAR